MKPMPPVTAFVLKVAAIVGMTCNHIANVFGSELPGGAMVALYSLGGLTFPIMAYLLCEGGRRTARGRRVAARRATCSSPCLSGSGCCGLSTTSGRTLSYARWASLEGWPPVPFATGALSARL